MSSVPYASAVGSLMYAMLCTRPDINLAISLVGRYQSNPGAEHWTAVKNILKYLKRTKEMFLVYGGDEALVVKGYVDASFDTDPDDSKSQTGYVYVLNGGAVSWCSSKQEVVAASTCEAEYIAAIMYAMLCTRPDVCLSISLAGRYQSNPRVDHLTAVKNILKYLKRTKDMFLVYGGDEELVVKGYVDASFNTDLDDSKSQTGYVYMLNGGAVSWCSCKQSVVAGSTCEAEYMAASEAAHEAIWVKEFITDLGVVPSTSGPMTLFCDNTGAIAIAKEPRFQWMTKHNQCRYNSIQD